MTEIQLFQLIQAPRELLWRYLSTARGLSCWQADEVRGDFETGEFSLRWPTLGARMDLSVKRAARGKSLTLGAGQNVLEIELNAEGVQLTHKGLEEGDDLEGLRCSWRLALATLKHAAECHPDKARRVNWQFSPIGMDRNLLHYYFSDPSGLSRWLGNSPSELVEQERYRLELDQSIIEGRVLVSETGRDLALSVEPLQEALLVLRSLPAPAEGRVVAAGISTFEEVDIDPLRQDIDLGLQRLVGIARESGRS